MNKLFIFTTNYVNNPDHPEHLFNPNDIEGSNGQPFRFKKDPLIYVRSSLPKSSKGILQIEEEFIKKLLEDVLQKLQDNDNTLLNSLQHIQFILHRLELGVPEGEHLRLDVIRKENQDFLQETLSSFFDKAKPQINFIAYRHEPKRSSIARILHDSTLIPTGDNPREYPVRQFFIDITEGLQNINGIKFKDKAQEELRPLGEKFKFSFAQYSSLLNQPFIDSDDSKFEFKDSVKILKDIQSNSEKERNPKILFVPKYDLGRGEFYTKLIEQYFKYNKDEKKFIDAPTPLIIISSENIMEKEETPLDVQSYYRFLDSSIWIRYVPAEDLDEFQKIFTSALNTIAWAYEYNLYDKNVTREFLEFNNRLCQNAYLASFGEESKQGGGHAGKITPFLFHSETLMEKRAKELYEELTGLSCDQVKKKKQDQKPEDDETNVSERSAEEESVPLENAQARSPNNTTSKPSIKNGDQGITTESTGHKNDANESESAQEQHSSEKGTGLRWNFLLIDDYADYELAVGNQPPVKSLKRSKGTLIQQLIEAPPGDIMDTNRIIGNKGGKIERAERIWNVEKKKEDEKEKTTAEQELTKGETIHDVILLDYLFSYDQGDRTHYGTELLEALLPDKKNKERNKIKITTGQGPFNSYWIHPVSVFSEAMISALHEKNIQHLGQHMYLARGADPINTPHLFRCSLYAFLLLQKDKIHFKEKDVFEFLAEHPPDLKDDKTLPITEWARVNFNVFTARFAAIYQLPKKSAFGRSAQKLISGTDYKDIQSLIESFQQLIYQLGFSTGFAAQILADEYTYIRNRFEQYDGEKKDDVKAQIEYLGEKVFGIYKTYF